MDAIVLKALAKDPDYRYQSADEMRADIEACLDGQPVAATAAMGAVGYGGYDGYGDGPADHGAARADQPAQTSMLPADRATDDGGYGYDDRPDRRRARRRATPRRSCWSLAGILVLVGAILIGRSVFGGDNGDNGKVDVPNMVGRAVDDAKDARDERRRPQGRLAGTLRDQPRGRSAARPPRTARCGRTRPSRSSSPPVRRRSRSRTSRRSPRRTPVRTWRTRASR